MPRKDNETLKDMADRLKIKNSRRFSKRTQSIIAETNALFNELPLHLRDTVCEEEGGDE